MEELSEEMDPAGAPATVYRRHLEKGKLGYQRCADCAAAVFYPRELCPVCGGGALLVTSAERAKDLRKPPVYLLGAGGHWHRNNSQMPDLTVTAATESGPRAYEMAGVSPADADVMMLYDAFTINQILFLEGLGFCEKGEGSTFVEGGRIAPGGELPVNTNGGVLSSQVTAILGTESVL